MTPTAYDGAAKATWTTLTQGINFSTPDADDLKLRQAIQLSEGIPQRKPGKN